MVRDASLDVLEVLKDTATFSSRRVVGRHLPARGALPNGIDERRPGEHDPQNTPTAETRAEGVHAKDGASYERHRELLVVDGAFGKTER